MQLLFEQQRVGAKRDEFLARDNPFYDLANFLVNERLAARDGDHRSSAFIDRLEAISDRQALVEDLVGIIDLAAAVASKVAAEQRLQHQHQRIALTAHQPLLEQIGADAYFFEERNNHRSCPWFHN